MTRKEYLEARGWVNTWDVSNESDPSICWREPGTSGFGCFLEEEAEKKQLTIDTKVFIYVREALSLEQLLSMF